MTTAPPPVVGIVLAAGAGSRLGTPKALVRSADGAPLVARAVAALADGGCARIVVVLGAEAMAAQRLLLGGPRVEVVVASDWAQGMGFSLRAGLDATRAAVAEEARAALEGMPPERVGVAPPDPPAPPVAVVVTLVDLPDVGADVVRRLADQARAGGPTTLARAAYQGRPGHPVVLGRAYWAAAAVAADGDRGARVLLANPRTVLVECGDLATGRDLDTGDDLADWHEGRW